MPNRSRLPAPSHVSSSILQDRIRAYIALPADHPAKIGVRTYGLGLLLSLGPALFRFVAKVIVSTEDGKHVDRVMTGEVVARLGRLLRRELGPFGFAFAITTAVAGGSFLRNVFENSVKPPDTSPRNGNVKTGATTTGSDPTRSVEPRPWCHCISLPFFQQTFLANALASVTAIILLQWRTDPSQSWDVPKLPLTIPIPTDDIPKHKDISPTLTLTLTLFVRALDSVVQGGLRGKLLQKPKGKECGVTPKPTESEEATSRDSVHGRNWINKWTSTLDSLVFCMCSARCDQSSY